MEILTFLAKLDWTTIGPATFLAVGVWYFWDKSKQTKKEKDLEIKSLREELKKERDDRMDDKDRFVDIILQLEEENRTAQQQFSTKLEILERSINGKK